MPDQEWVMERRERRRLWVLIAKVRRHHPGSPAYRHAKRDVEEWIERFARRLAWLEVDRLRSIETAKKPR